MRFDLKPLWLGLLVSACAAGETPYPSSPSSYPGPYPSAAGSQPVIQPTNTTNTAPTAPPVPATPVRPVSPARPFVLTDADPFSTFAADVDTASYDIFRRSLGNRMLPLPSEVRIEEYVNYFEYDYPAPEPDAEVPFTISLAASSNVNAEDGTKLLRVGIQGARPASKPATNLVFLVDVSGSMAAANKLPLVKTVIEETLDELDLDDEVSIVTYAADTRVRLAPTPARDRDRIEAVVDALQAGGGTNGASGIQLAYEQAQAGMIEGGINHIVLCTDGDFNLGISDPDQLVALIKQKRQTGVTLTALGFGERNNDSMMERVSDAGNGIYSVLYDADQAIAYAHQRLLSTMIHIAKDMKIQVEFNPEHVYAYRLIGYEDRAVADTQFRNDRVDGGEVGAGHRVTALFELALTADDVPAGVTPTRGESTASRVEQEIAAEELVRVKVRWKKPGASSADPASETNAALTPEDVGDSLEALDDDAKWAVAVSYLAATLRSDPRARRSELPRLRTLIEPLANDRSDRFELLSLWPRVEELLRVR